MICLDKSEKRWLIGGSLFLAFVIILCVSSPYWDKIGLGGSKCSCPWCMAEQYAEDGGYEIEYKHTDDSMSVIVRRSGSQETVSEQDVDGQVPVDEVVDEYNPDAEGYWIVDDNGMDIVLYNDGHGRYWYVDSSDGYPVVTDRRFEGEVYPTESEDESFVGYDDDVAYTIDEDGNVYVEG